MKIIDMKISTHTHTAERHTHNLKIKTIGNEDTHRFGLFCGTFELTSRSKFN
jgi:hypothetical protein